MATDSASLGRLLRQRRRQLDLTQQEIARKVGVRANYIGYLERDMRRPSTTVLVKLAKVLDLDRQELFFLAHPQVRGFLDDEVPEPRQSVWKTFRANKRLHTRHGITNRELRVLEGVAGLGTIQSARDLLHVLQSIRQALTVE
ncbi:MAG: helix-turn-helix transcriptional regulator [Deltaproteobacteria bacterium]|nr:helix-turn-helix transcriptional regulator [Deltaproteobacteria bacterium]